MPRLITFGCSHTFGYGMPDNFPIDYKTFKPSEYGWPSILAKKLGYEVCNEGLPSLGNIEIFDRVLRFDFNKDDLCIIMWSYFVRLDFFTIDFEYKTAKINNARIPPLSYTNAYKNYLVIQHANLYLTSKGIKHYMFLASNDDGENYPCPKYIKIDNMIDMNSKLYFIDKALDKLHFGQKSHEKLAEMLIEKAHLG